MKKLDIEKINFEKKESLDIWNIEKKIINNRVRTKHFKERDIVFISLGENIGFEQNGKGKKFLRPVLVYKKFSSSVFLGIPLTSQEKKGKFYKQFSFKEKDSFAILSQIRLFDSKRIEYSLGTISKGNYMKIQKKLIELLQ